MRLIILVAIDAVARRLAVRHVWGMAAFARGNLMPAGQGEVRLPVIEGFKIQKQDAKTAPLVICVAVIAVRGLCLGRTAMETRVFPQVAGDFLVAVQAQLNLCAFGKVFVAIAAILLQIGMGLGQIARQHEAFEKALRCGFASDTRTHDQGRGENDKESAPKTAHGVQ